jgi:hypothetical protein
MGKDIGDRKRAWKSLDFGASRAALMAQRPGLSQLYRMSDGEPPRIVAASAKSWLDLRLDTFIFLFQMAV